MKFFRPIPGYWCKIMKITLGQVFIAILLTSVSYASSSSAQKMLNNPVTLSVEKTSLGKALKMIEKQADVKFAYSKSIINIDQQVSVSANGQSLDEVLSSLLTPIGISYRVVNQRIVLSNTSPPKIAVAADSSGTDIASLYQAFPVSGKIVDENGQPLPGVSVRINKSDQGTISDPNGSFTLNSVKETDTLNFSFIGYQNQSVAVGNQKVFTIKMVPSSADVLKEVVVVGYGTSTKANLTTSIGSVKGSEVNERPTSLNALQGLAGKVAGVNIMENSGRPGGAPEVTIRGISSINSSLAPLYVIDGFVGADPTTIDPSIIESVDVYKDAAASAIYGSRGANGVIVITTKKGKDGVSQIAFNNSVSFGSLEREIPLLNASEFTEMLRRQYAYVPGRIAPNDDPNNNFTRKTDLFDSNGNPKYNTDWQKAATRTAVSDNHSLTFTGGKDGLNILANFSYRNNQGILLNSYQKQLSAYINVGWDVKPWLHIQANINSFASQGNNPETNTFGLNAVREMYEFPDIFPVTYPDGTASRKGDYPGLEDSENPVTLLNEIKNVSGVLNTTGNFVGTFHIVKHLDFNTTFSGQTGSTYTNYFAPNNLDQISEAQNGVAQRTNGTSASWTNENYFSYDNQFKDHHLNVIAGVSWYDYRTSSTFAGAENFFDNTFEDYNLGVGTVVEPPSSSQSENQRNSFFTRANYNYKEKYFLEASLRDDGTSKVGVNNQYGLFPSFSAAWRISNEDFFKKQSTISNLKLRGSYGVVGNSEIPNYSTITQYVSSPTVFNGNEAAAVTLSSSFGNPNLRWEKDKQADIGIDAGFLHDRIQVVADVYNKTSTDLLYNKLLPATSGYSNAWDNIGSIRNRGFEITVNTVNITNKDFKWSTSVNFSVNRSKVLNINGDTLYSVTTFGRVVKGDPLNEFYGYIREGVWGTSEAAQAAKFSGSVPGDVKYADLNHDGVLDAGDQTDLGNAMPSWQAEMTNTISYKNFTFYLDLEGMYGNNVYNVPAALMEDPNPNVNSFKSILSAWTPTNQNTLQPELRLPNDHFSYSNVDNYYLQNASFLRVRNVALSYTFTQAWLKTILVKTLNIGVNVENALLFTKYKGYDPEASSFGGGLEQGLDVYQYPKPRTVSLSLNATF